MFNQTAHHKKSGGIFGLVRLMISLVIFTVLGIGLYQAYRSFSGFDPLKLNPSSIGHTIVASDTVYKVVIGLLSFTPTNSFQDFKASLSQSKGKVAKSTPNLPVKFTFAVVADSHLDTDNLKKALHQIEAANAKFVVGLGDFSDVGTIDQLTNTKLSFDTLNIPYYVAPGDHDLWDARNQKKDPVANFMSVFGTPYQSFSYENTRLILYYNSDNYQGLDSLQLNWLQNELQSTQANPGKTVFAFGATPLYHPSSDHVMGKVEPKLKDQAAHLISLFSKAGVSEVFAADTHYFTRYTEPTFNLKMTTVGAITSDRNPQSPRFALIDVFEDGSYNVREIEVQ